jgi:hypothetical protein
MNKDSSVFTDELFLIKDISMKTLWESDLSNKTKQNIWKYLNIFCLINLNLVYGDVMTNAQNKLMSGEKITKKELAIMKKFKKINENINIEYEEDENNSKNPMEGLEDTAIGNLAKEITGDLNINEDNAEDLLKPENMMNIFQSINSTLKDKIDSNEIDMNKLFGEASGLMNNGMMENMMGMFGNMMGANSGRGGEGDQMPDLSNMMNMLGAQAQPTPKPQSQQSQSKSRKSNNHDPDVVKERLRKKLESKK